MLVLTYEREFVKGYWRKIEWEIPKHAFYEVYAEDVPIFLNFLTFLLPMAAADKAFWDYGSVCEVRCNSSHSRRIDKSVTTMMLTSLALMVDLSNKSSTASSVFHIVTMSSNSFSKAPWK